jgi:chromosomal replication initiation ATPase DnaA
MENLPPTIRRITRDVATRRRINPAVLFTPSQYREVVEARWEIWARANAENARIYTTLKLGELFSRHHSTVVHGLASYRAGRRSHQNSSRPKRVT